MELTRDRWTDEDHAVFGAYLRSLADEKYKEFHGALTPGEHGEVIGVRIPKLREIAKKISKGDAVSFLSCRMGGSAEERIIEGLVLASKKCGADELWRDICRFADRIDSWAVNDTVKFLGIKKYRGEIKEKLRTFLDSADPWHIRYALKILMDFYLDDTYIDSVLREASEVRSDHYYVRMMQGWLFATAAVRYPEKVFRTLEDDIDDYEVVRITAGKMRDSYRISAENKARAAELKTRAAELKTRVAERERKNTAETSREKKRSGQ